MKILATIPLNYSSRYIVELGSDELSAITVLTQHSSIPVTHTDGKEERVEKDKLRAGDTIADGYIKAVAEDVRTLLEQASEIDKAMAGLRTSMTKMQNVMNSK